MFSNDEELINDFHVKSGHKYSSIQSYKTVFNKYRDFHSMSLCELLNEAFLEQENNTPENKLMIYDRIISFRNHLIENHVGNTITSAISKIKTFYHYNRVYLPFIPPLNKKIVRKNTCISFDDLLTKDELRDVLAIACDDLKMWVLVMISSGSTRTEAKSMTNETFFRGTWDYHKKDNFEDALKYLSRKNNVVCTCKLVRQKTDKPYYTFLNPECVQSIAKIKLKRNDFNLNDTLLRYELNHVNYKCKRINDLLGLGEVGGYSRFRPHMLRKFNSTYLNQGSIDSGLNRNDVDRLHGRGKNQTRESYFKDNPAFLKFEYVKAMNNISLYHEYDWRMVNGKMKISAKKL